jgi:hypothetical protein
VIPKDTRTTMNPQEVATQEDENLLYNETILAKKVVELLLVVLPYDPKSFKAAVEAVFDHAEELDLQMESVCNILIVYLKADQKVPLDNILTKMTEFVEEFDRLFLNLLED